MRRFLTRVPTYSTKNDPLQVLTYTNIKRKNLGQWGEGRFNRAHEHEMQQGNGTGSPNPKQSSAAMQSDYEHLLH